MNELNHKEKSEQEYSTQNCLWYFYCSIDTIGMQLILAHLVWSHIQCKQECNLITHMTIPKTNPELLL